MRHVRIAARRALPPAPALWVLLAVLVQVSPAGDASAASLIVDGPPGASVLIDGRSAGVLPLGAPLAVEPGAYELRCELRGYQPFVAELTVAEPDELLRVVARLTPLRRPAALLYGLVFAGFGQQYVGRPRLGWALSALELGGLAAALAGELSYGNRRDDYEALYDAYLNAITAGAIAAAREAAAQKYAQMEDAESLRDTGLIVAAGAVTVGLLDVWLRFPSVEAGAGAVPAHAAAPRDGLVPAAVHVAWIARF